MTSETTTSPTEKVEQSFAEFLETSPPSKTINITDLMELKWDGGSQLYYLKTPEIQIHCYGKTCNGVRFHRCIEGNKLQIRAERPVNCFIRYVCSNCQNNYKTFAITAYREDDETSGTLTKYGENPTFGPPIPPRLLKLIGPDRENFLRGRRCETQGLGVGAFVYYRRVVENQKNRILSEIIKVSEKIGAPKERIDILTTALAETQFKKALEITKDAMPESLLINGHSPLMLLHRALSEGIHNRSDDDCLDYASSVRVVLGELSERLSQALKDEAEITNALTRLLVSTKQ